MARFRFKDGDGCTVGAIDFDIPNAPGRITVAAVGGDKADALGKAALVAERIANDPIMAALMPPQALMAIKAAKGLAAAARRGSHVLRMFRRKLKGPGAKRLAKVLHDEAATSEGHDVGDIGGLWSGVKKAASYHPAAIVARKLRGKKKRRKVQPMRRQVEREESPPDDDEQMDNQADDGGDYADDEGGEE